MTGLTWHRREPPLAAVAVLARAEIVPTLARRLADDGDPGRLRAVAADGWLLVLAAEAALPWVPGVTYLGWDGALLLPTTHRPSLPVDLIARSLRRTHGEELTVLLPDAVLTAAVPSRPIDISAITKMASR